MTLFEFGYSCAEPLLSPLWTNVRHKARMEVKRYRVPPRVLDIGGRKSHYPRGLRGKVVITDLPRTTELQNDLNLGVLPHFEEQLRRRRSNVEALIVDDMTCSKLEAESFDIAIAVEVLEHVEADDAFLANVARVLRKGGTFIMTTPNGDAIPHPSNSGHKRHYRKEQLESLLSRHFHQVEVRYKIRQSHGLGRRHLMATARVAAERLQE